MRILIVCDHYAVCSGRYYADAFKRIGHEVKTAGRSMQGNIWGGTVARRYHFKPDFQLDQYAGMKEFDPDLVICADSDPYILNWFYEPYFERNIVIGVDNHVREYRRHGFKHYFFAHREVALARFPGTTWLPCGYDHVAFTPSPISWEKRKYDVAMIGVMYPERHRLVNLLKRAGLNVFAGTGQVYDQYAKVYHNSRAALVHSIRRDLNIRVFEGMGLGCATLVGNIPDLNSFKEAPLMHYLDNDELLIELARRAQQIDPAAANTSAAEAAAYARAHHSFDVRAQVVIDWYDQEYGVKEG